jgi:hypothetical protein
MRSDKANRIAACLPITPIRRRKKPPAQGIGTSIDAFLHRAAELLAAPDI